MKTVSYTNRSNARRAARRMLAEGQAPAKSFEICSRRPDCHEIVWLTSRTVTVTPEWAEAEASTVQWFPGTESTHFAGRPVETAESAIEAEAAAEPRALTHAEFAQTPQAQADKAGWDGMHARAAEQGWSNTDPSERGAEGSEPTAEPVAETSAVAPMPAHATAADAAYVSRAVSRAIRFIGRLDLTLADLAGAAGYRLVAKKVRTPRKPRGEKRARRGAEASTASRSRYGHDAETIAAGRLPEAAPLVTSAANKHYQKHFDRLHQLAVAGEWQGVADYPVTGSNSYAKMVARYRLDLLAVRAAAGVAEAQQ